MVGKCDELLGGCDRDFEAADRPSGFVAARRNGFGDLFNVPLLEESVVEGSFGLFDVAVRGSAMAPLGRLVFAVVRCPPMFAGGLDRVVRRCEGWPVGLTCLVGFGESPRCRG